MPLHGQQCPGPRGQARHLPGCAMPCRARTALSCLAATWSSSLWAAARTTLGSCLHTDTLRSRVCGPGPWHPDACAVRTGLGTTLCPLTFHSCTGPGAARGPPLLRSALSRSPLPWTELWRTAGSLREAQTPTSLQARFDVCSASSDSMSQIIVCHKLV